MIMLKTAIEFALVVLLIYGFAHEKQVIEFEQLLVRAIVIKYKLYKRNKSRERMRKNRDFKLIRGNGRTKPAQAQSGSLHVA